jgi:hypothetical protein
MASKEGTLHRRALAILAAVTAARVPEGTVAAMRWKYRRSVEALIASVAAYLLAYRIAQPEVSLSGVPGTLALGLLAVLPLAAITLAILALRGIRVARTTATQTAERASYLPASVALILALAFVATFGFYAVARLR